MSLSPQFHVEFVFLGWSSKVTFRFRRHQCDVKRDHTVTGGSFDFGEEH
jgi:hypothetical protein